MNVLHRFRTKNSLALLFAGILLVGSCASLRKSLQKYAPVLTLKSMQVDKLDINGADVDFVYEMRNKVSLSMTFSRLAFRLFVDENKLLDADNKKNIELKPKGTSTFTIRHRIVYREFADSLVALFQKESVQVKLEGKVGVLIPTLNETVEVPFGAEMKVPVPKLPKIEFEKFRYVSANLNPFKPRAKFELSFKMHNPNPFPVTLAPSGYSFTAAGQSLINGQTAETLLPPKGEKRITVPVNLQGREIISLVPKLRDLSANSYRFSGELNIKTLGQPIKLPFAIP